MSDIRYIQETVTGIHFWVEKHLFSITTTHSPDFQFKPGQFARVGLPANAGEAPSIWRGFSMVRPPEDNALEFYAVVLSFLFNQSG